MSTRSSITGLCHQKLQKLFLIQISTGILLLISLTVIQGQEQPDPKDTPGQIRIENALLDRFKKQYQLMDLESFEDKKPWQAYANSTMLSRIQFVRKFPTDPAYDLEKKMIHDHIHSAYSFDKSLSIHTSFDIPGEQNFKLSTAEPKGFYCVPRHVSLWVRSNDYKHTLYLEFINLHHKTYQQKVSQLDFNGWQRFKLNLPQSIFRLPKITDSHQKHKFRGFVIKSHPKESAGALNILIDNLLLFCHKQVLEYPGSQIKDKWD